MSLGTISTHAPRTGSDFNVSSIQRSQCVFQPTLPARGATQRPAEPASGQQFQPTLPARGATRPGTADDRPGPYFNPRSPHGERRTSRKAENGHEKISTHAPRTGSDDSRPSHKRQNAYFNPRSPHGERLHSTRTPPRRGHFNPRSPHGERPPAASQSTPAASNFNPRSPHGERLHLPLLAPPAGDISTHAPRTGSDPFFLFA